ATTEDTGDTEGREPTVWQRLDAARRRSRRGFRRRSRKCKQMSRVPVCICDFFTESPPCGAASNSSSVSSVPLWWRVFGLRRARGFLVYDSRMKYQMRALVPALCGVAAAGAVVFAADYTLTVNRDRLINAQNEPQNWLLMNGDYGATRYSKLAQINRD